MASKNPKTFERAGDLAKLYLPKHLRPELAVCPKHGKMWQYRNLRTNELFGCEQCTQERELQERRTKRQQHLRSAMGAPMMFQDKRFSDYVEQNESQRHAKRLCISYAQGFDQTPQRSLILSGTVGTGKTHLGIAVLNHLVDRLHHCRYTNLSQLFAAVKATYGAGESKTESEVINSYIEPELLFLDEVGLTDLSKTEQHILYQVIDGRYTRLKGTIIATNLSPEHLDDNIGERLIDRLREHGGVLVPMRHKSYRRAAA